MLVAVILVLASKTVVGLVGDNVCQEEHRYIINVTEYFLRNSTVRNYQWCLNIPPRCSIYSTKLINDSRVAEKEATHFSDTCCPGYTEDKNTNRCTPICPDCHNGTCIQGQCSCLPGYKGLHCNLTCENSEWGENCKNRCSCNGNSCHPETGICICPPGFTGTQCSSPCEPGFYGADCRHRCTCDPNSSCNTFTGECLPSSTTHPPLNTIQFSNNGKFEINNEIFISTTGRYETTETQFPFSDDDEDKRNIDQMTVNNHISSSQSVGNEGVYASTTSGPVEVMKSKAKVNSKEVIVNANEGNFLNDDARNGNPQINKNDLVNGASAATAISAGIIIVAGVIVAANHFKRNKKKIKRDEERTKGVSTVAVYTHSIFHTPLPEPPIFENPIFASPAETNPTSEGRFETHVVCSMNFPAHANIKDQREYLYDHPPSTGSYRAASIPEPPDIDTNQSSVHSEPLYDEIPSGVAPTPITQPPPPYKSSSLYMNTCGRTRF